MVTTVFVAPICIAVVNTSCDKFYRDTYTRHVSVLHLDTLRLRNRHAKLLPWLWFLSLRTRNRRSLVHYRSCKLRLRLFRLGYLADGVMLLNQFCYKNKKVLALNCLYSAFLISVDLLELLTDYYSYRVFKSNFK